MGEAREGGAGDNSRVGMIDLLPDASFLELIFGSGGRAECRLRLRGWHRGLLLLLPPPAALLALTMSSAWADASSVARSANTEVVAIVGDTSIYEVISGLTPLDLCVFLPRNKWHSRAVVSCLTPPSSLLGCPYIHTAYMM